MSEMTAQRPKTTITHPKNQSSHRWVSPELPIWLSDNLVRLHLLLPMSQSPDLAASPASKHPHQTGLPVSLQVTQRGAEKQAAALHYSSPSDAPLEGQVSWRERLRALFCCFAPDASEQYYRGSEGEAAVIRPPQPPTPPSYSGEPVIGPLQAWHTSHASTPACRTAALGHAAGCQHAAA
jgi:hypothetical protein